MAGDLFVENISYDYFLVLIQAGAVISPQIQHAQRDWNAYQDRLTERLLPGAANSRLNLPAHSYVSFNAANVNVLTAYAADNIQKARLGNFLDKVSRPLRSDIEQS